MARLYCSSQVTRRYVEGAEGILLLAWKIEE
jgi:hypothetical protein